MEKENERYKALEKEMVTAEKIEKEVWDEKRFKTSTQDLVDFTRNINRNLNDNKFKTKLNSKILHLCDKNFIIIDNALYINDDEFKLDILNVNEDNNYIIKYNFSHSNINTHGIYILYKDGSYSTYYENSKIKNGKKEEVQKEYNSFDENGVQISKETLEVNESKTNERSSEQITKTLYIRKNNQFFKMKSESIFPDKIKDERQRCNYEEIRSYYISDETNEKELTGKESYNKVSFEEYKLVLKDNDLGKVKLRQKY